MLVWETRKTKIHCKFSFTFKIILCFYYYISVGEKLCFHLPVLFFANSVLNFLLLFNNQYKC